MGGFVAIFDTSGAPIDGRLLRNMMDVPPYDAASGVVWAADGVGLGASPLVTPSALPTPSPLRSPHHVGAPQPLACGDRLRIVMDGRLDNRAALVRRLEVGLEPRGGLDRRLGAASDVALALAAYELWGTDCASHLLGDFSFCVWDADHRHLFCARDHLGVKPLYYSQLGTTLVVSNVLRSVRRHPQVSTRLDEAAIGDFLLYWTCLEPSRTSFADVARVPPAHTLTVSEAGRARLARYWALEPEDSLRLRRPAEYIERYVSTLETVVGDRVGLGPAGILMSGGLDSSSVAAAAASVVGPATTPTALRAYTAVYDTVEQDQERHYSTLVARALRIPIEHYAMDGYRWFERWNASLLPPEPSAEPMTAMMADLLEQVSRHSGVVLTGDGGDPALLPSTLAQSPRTGAARYVGQRLLCLGVAERAHFRQSVRARPSVDGGRLLRQYRCGCRIRSGDASIPMRGSGRSIDAGNLPKDHEALRSALWWTRGGPRCSRRMIQARRSGRLSCGTLCSTCGS